MMKDVTHFSRYAPNTITRCFHHHSSADLGPALSVFRSFSEPFVSLQHTAPVVSTAFSHAASHAAQPKGREARRVLSTADVGCATQG